MKLLSPIRNSCLRALALLAFVAQPLVSQTVPHQIVTVPGGAPGAPVMTGINRLTNGVGLTWDGPAGYYQVFQKSNSLTAPWVALGKATNLVRAATVTKFYSNAFFRVAGPAPKYAGSKVCLTCHLDVCRYETNTPHAAAFSDTNFIALGGQTDKSCLPCHTVGYGLATGFVSATATPLLAGVQCENCHGPAANHAASPDDPAIRPRVEIAATVCGGCHSASHTSYANAPTYEEWNASEHALVDPAALQAMISSTNNLNNCGACHSGSVRLSFINGQNPVSLTNDLNVAISCAVCHDPHATNANPVQLRNPVASTSGYYFAAAGATTLAVFTNEYAANAGVNLCAQCHHNDRGASWTNTAVAPHYSPQYDFLLGTAGEFTDGSAGFNPGTHAGLPASAIHSVSGNFYLTNQCVACHMQPGAVSRHSHDLALTYGVCANCHLGDPQALAQSYWQPQISNDVATVIYALNRWAALKAPAALLTNGAVAWEYPSANGLVWSVNSSGQVTGWSQSSQTLTNFNGPGVAFQSVLTNYPGILKARYDLYLVLGDGSLGIHNPDFAQQLLGWQGAVGLVVQELSK